MDDEHYERVLAFNDDQRYAYFVSHVVEGNRVFGLMRGDDQWLVWEVEESGDRDVFPVWPHPRLAEAAAGDDHPGFAPQFTDLDEFLRFLDDLQQEEVLVGVMPYPDGSQLIVEPADLKGDLEDFRSGAYADAGDS